MKMNNLIIKQVDGLTGCVQIRLASGVTNVLNTEVLAELRSALDEAECTASCVLLCGGDKFFSNGVDLTWALEQSTAHMREMFMQLGDCIVQIMESPLPVVGAIKGHAIGGALALLLACDYRFGSNGRTLIGKPEILLGVPNPYFGDQLLRFVAGDFIASDLIYTGKLVTAEEGTKLNLIHGVSEPAEVENLALERLEFLTSLAPEAFAESKRMRSARFCADLRAQMSSRVARQVEIWNGEQAQARLHEAAKRLSR